MDVASLIGRGSLFGCGVQPPSDKVECFSYASAVCHQISSSTVPEVVDREEDVVTVTRGDQRSAAWETG